MKAEPEIEAWASALYELAKASDAIDRYDDDLSSAIQTIGGHARLRETLDDPKVPLKAKGAIVVEVFSETVSAPVVGALVALAEQGRQSLLPAIYERYEETSQAERNVVIADVTTAVPLDEALRPKLEKELEAIADRKVILREHVDESILGGVIVRMAGKVMDGSVRSRLETLREQMVGARSEA